MLELDGDHSICLRKKGELLRLHLETLSGTVRVWLVQVEDKGSVEMMLHLMFM